MYTFRLARSEQFGNLNSSLLFKKHLELITFLFVYNFQKTSFTRTFTSDLHVKFMPLWKRRVCSLSC